MLPKLIQSIPSIMKKHVFGIYIVSLICAWYSFKFSLPEPAKVISLIILIIAQLFYNFKVDMGKFVRNLNWVGTVGLILILIAYVSALFGEFTVSVFSLISVFYVILGFIITSYLGDFLWIKNNFNQKPILKLVLLVIYYLVTALLLIVLFGSFYSIIEPMEGNTISGLSKDPGIESYKFIYFSGTVFYSLPFGDLVPNGWSKWLSLFEISISYAFHIIFLGIIIQGPFLIKDNGTRTKTIRKKKPKKSPSSKQPSLN